ncbi:MAG: hypothetical protein HXS46_04495, partial [Theionarchaea archaeon]|nr:hypothetical protein [Theionarchaea archaeon]
IYGTWLPAEDGEGNPTQTKLQLWAKTSFSYTRYSTRDYEDGFIEDNPNYPCIPGYTGKTICVEFDDLPLGTYRRELEHHSIKFRVPGWLSIIENSWQVEETSYQRALKIIHKLDFSPIFVVALPEEAYGVTVDLWAESSFVPPAGVVHFLEADGTVVDTQYLVDGKNRIKYGRFFCLPQKMKNDTTSDNDPRNHTREKIKYLVFVVMKELCIFKICYLPVSECEKEKKYYEYRNRTQTMFAHWYHEGNILEPYTKYRLKIITNITRRENGAQTENEICEYAFFRTEGPPGFVELTKKELPKSLLFEISSNVDTIINSLNSGSISDELKAEFLENGITLSESVHVEQDEEKWSIVDTADGERIFIVEKRESTLNVYREIKHENPLDSLDLYVKDTMPKNGQHPFYRAYDMGVAFRKDYVELMYKIAHHDLGIYLFDNDGRPVKDAFGRIITFSNVWGKPEEVKLTEEEEIYVWLMENSLCIDLDRNYIPPKDILDNHAKNRFLLPQKLYEARVIPMLFHETFEYESIEGWTIEDEGWTIKDEGNIERPSSWHPSKDPDNHSIRFLAQTSNIHTVISGELDIPYCRGTYIYYGEEDWADYRLTVILASGDDDAIGVMFRYQDPNNYYRFSIDRKQKYRRLIKMENGRVQRLAEDDWKYKKDRTYTVTIEAVKNSIAIFMDGELIFNVTDENPFLKGKIAPYCWANEDARFYEVAVEDLSENAQSVYKYQFSPSQYANFFHLIHSFDDKIWPVDLPDGSNLQGEKFEEVWPDHIQLPQQVEIDLIKKENQNVGFLLKSPEPVEWPRVALDVMKSNTLAHLGMPGAVKITSFGKNSEQWVDLLIREDTSLYNWRIEYADNPEDLQWKPFYTFKGFKLFTKTEFSDEDFQPIPSVEGSYFIDGDTTWKNYRVTADFELYGNYQEAGILFRCKDEGNYYKLVISNISGIKLLKKVNHNITILWESPHVRNDKFFKLRDGFAARLEKGISKESELKMRYRVIVEIDGSKITILVNGEHYFEVNDSENNIDHGCVGAFFLPEAKVIFEKLSVISLEKKSFCSGQQIRVNSAEKQVSHSETMLVFDTERSIPELIEVSSGIAFRILDENGTTIHQRTFLSKEEFTDAGTFCVVPSADGTAALILLEDSNHIEENNLYRFAFTFSRKKEGLPVLKQWGQDTCELASIEFRL